MIMVVVDRPIVPHRGMPIERVLTAAEASDSARCVCVKCMCLVGDVRWQVPVRHSVPNGVRVGIDRPALRSEDLPRELSRLEVGEDLRTAVYTSEAMS